MNDLVVVRVMVRVVSFELAIVDPFFGQGRKELVIKLGAFFVCSLIERGKYLL